MLTHQNELQPLHCAEGIGCRTCKKSVAFDKASIEMLHQNIAQSECLIVRSVARIALLRRALKQPIGCDPQIVYAAILADDYDKFVHICSAKISLSILDTIVDYDADINTRLVASLAAMVAKSEIIVKTVRALSPVDLPPPQDYHQFWKKWGQDKELWKILPSPHGDAYVNTFSRAYELILQGDKLVPQLFIKAMRAMAAGKHGSLQTVTALTPKYPIAYVGAGYVQFVKDVLGNDEPTTDQSADSHHSRSRGLSTQHYGFPIG